ncbi:Tetratricopeptide repeat protein 25 [Rhizophlyctis rosea]|nr:Tetratricopeptide repeat protein 25 [Rhizophlyctis rosea]
MAEGKQPAPPPLDPEDPEALENPLATFQTLAASGDLLAQRGNYIQAIEAYTRALTIRPTDKHCLVSRSRCHIKTGSPTLALQDADSSLKEDPSFFKGIFQKAEALYAQGDFELALMFYHRGNRLRPELDEFRIGIQKAREAIENSIGHPREFRIQVPAKLRKALGGGGHERTPDGGGGGGKAFKAGPRKSTAMSAAGGGGAGGGGGGGEWASAAAGAGPLTAASEGKLLGELHDDKLYLEELLSDRDLVEHPDPEVLGLITEGLRYLEARADFWSKQNPLYARPKEKRIKPRMERGHIGGGGPVGRSDARRDVKGRHVQEKTYTKIPPIASVSAE